MRDSGSIRFKKDELEIVTPTPILNLPDIVEEACYAPKNGEPYKVFECKPARKMSGGCPSCKSELISIHGYLPKRRLVHDVLINGNEQVDLHLKTPRYRCESCGATFVHRFESVMENRQMTYRLYDQIRRETFVHTFKEVSIKYGYSIPTVTTIFDEYSDELQELRKPVYAPRILGIDEKKVGDKARGVLVDIETGTLLEMTDENKRKNIIGAIENLVDYDTVIKIVTMDMSGGYRSHVQECLPNATIVVDRFHMIQDMGTKVTKTRTKLIAYREHIIEKLNDPEEKKRQKALLKEISRTGFLFKYNAKKLSSKNEILMTEACLAFPEFNHLRLLKEGFEAIYECTDRVSAEEEADYWQRLVPPSRLQDVPEWEQEFGVSAELFDEFRTLKNTVMKNWHTEIFNYFNPDCRFTNAATEGLNNLIGRIDRQGAGYSFERLRQKVLLHHLAKPKARYKSERKTVPVYEKQSIGKSTSTLGLVIPDTPKIIGYKEICEIVDISQYLYREPLSVFSYLPQDYIDL